MLKKTLVCTFLSRGVWDKPDGQGDEILLYLPAERRDEDLKDGDIPGALRVMMLETIEPTTAGGDLVKAASLSSLSKHCLLSEGEVRLVRRGKRIPWTKESYIESFLWRVSFDYERGKAHHELREEQIKQRRTVDIPSEGDEQIYNHRLSVFRGYERRLDFKFHAWASMGEINIDSTKLEKELNSTAYFSVVLPEGLENDLLWIATRTAYSQQQYIGWCLDIMYGVIQAGIGRTAFKLWPKKVLSMGAKVIPHLVYKHRLFSYWIDVVVYYLRLTNPALDDAITYSILRILSAVESKLVDGTCDTEEFEKEAEVSIVKALSQEKFDAELLARNTVTRIFETAVREKRNVLTIIAVSHTPVMYAVLKEILMYVMTAPPTHPYTAFHPGVGTLPIDIALKQLAQPIEFHLVVAEGRPSGEGVALAQYLYGIIQESATNLHNVRSVATPYDIPTLQRCAKPSDVIGSVASLSHQVKINFQETGVSFCLEIISDASVCTAIMAAGSGGVTLIGAKNVVPETGNIVAHPPAHAAATISSKVAGGKTYALSPIASIQPYWRSSAPSFSVQEAKGATAAWTKMSAPNQEGMEEFIAQVEDGGDPMVKATYWDEEIVPSELIAEYITELGMWDKDKCLAKSQERGKIETRIVGTNSE